MEQPRSDEDQQLVARTQNGEAAAFDQLVVKYTPRLYGLVYNMTSNHEDTNDLLQDVFSKAYKSIGGFRGKSSFYTWIHSIAVNMTLKLSDEHRAVVTMFHIQGMPHAEISKILRVSEGTVRSRLFYANRQLQNYLEEFRKNPVS